MASVSKQKSTKSSKDGQTSKLNTVSDKFTQDLIGLNSIHNGLFFMDNGQIVGIQEILPLNYYHKTISDRNSIYSTFLEFFNVCPKNIHFKTRTEKANVDRIVARVREACKGQSEKIRKNGEHYIRYIKRLQKAETVCKRYYVIWKYEGNENGEKSRDLDTIYQDMERIRQSMASIGNPMYTPSDINSYVCELLYNFFNPKTCLTESYTERIERIRKDAEKWNKGLKNKKPFYEEDFIAPKGLKLRKDHVLMDGIYHTYLIFKSDGHPSRAEAGWLDTFSMDYGIDVDVIAKKIPRELAKKGLQKANSLGRGIAAFAREKASKEKADDIMASNANREYIYDALRAGEDAWDCIIIITIRGEDYQATMAKRDEIYLWLKGKHFFTSKTDLDGLKYLMMTMPFMYIDNRIFGRNKQNYLSSSMATLYNYTSEDSYDDKGIVLGYNRDNGSIISFNPFNRDVYLNSNILITGSSGSGKTNTQLAFTRRAYLSGMRVFYILPHKGYEYREAVEDLDGSFITLLPGNNVCLNIMEISPETTPDVMAYDSPPLLAKKIKTVLTFIQILLGKNALGNIQLSRLEGVLKEIYSRYGITDNDESIWADVKHTKLKPMPTLGMISRLVAGIPELNCIVDALQPFTDGEYSNFNKPSNVDLTNKCIALNIDAEAIRDDMLPAIMFIGYDCFYRLAKSSTSRDIIVMDEAWKMLGSPYIAEQINQMVRLVRAYSCSTIIASQNITDFLKTEDTKSIVKNTEIQFIHKIKPAELAAVAELTSLTDAELKMIKGNKKQGECVMFSSGDKTRIKIILTYRERYLFETEPTAKEKLKAELRANPYLWDA